MCNSISPTQAANPAKGKVSDIEENSGPIPAVGPAPPHFLSARPPAVSSTNWKPPYRADEALTSLDSRTFEVPIPKPAPPFPYDQFSIYVPTSALGTAQNKVHVFFAAMPVTDPVGNDILIHGLRASAERFGWILIGVAGFETGFFEPPLRYVSNGGILDRKTITTDEINLCLVAAGRSARIDSLRLTAHSRGHRGLETTIKRKLVDLALVEKIVVLDAFYQDMRRTLLTTRDVNGIKPAVEPTKIYQYDLVDNYGWIVNRNSYRSFVPKDVTLEKKQPKVSAATISGFAADTVINLSDVASHLAGLGCLRLLQDMIAAGAKVPGTNQTVATLLLLPANAAVSTTISSLILPPRGSFVTGIPGPGQESLKAFINKPANKLALDSIVNGLLSSSGLGAFINNHSLLSDRFGSLDVSLFAHHFFVGELSYEWMM